MSTVVTYDGTLHPKEKCRKIKNRFYLIGDVNVKDSGQCYLIDDKYVRINSGLIEYDHEQKRYVRIKDYNLTEGVIAVEGNTLVKGYFTANPIKIVQVFDHINENTLYAISDNIFNSNFEEMANGVFYDIGYLKSKNNYTRYSDPFRSASSGSYEEFKSGIYNLEEHPQANMSVEMYKKYPHKEGKYKWLEPFIKNISFGGEFETSNGRIPVRHLIRNGVIPLRDGSIGGHEYTTIPLATAKGIAAIDDFCEQAAKFCTVGTECSLHYHFGNIEFDKTFIVAFYALMCRLQGEMFSIIPPFKKTPEFIHRKGGKDHNQDLNDLGLMYNEIVNDGKINLKEINVWYKRIVKFLNEGKDKTEYIREGANKWECPTRYYCVNILNAVFKPKQKKTVEFRSHTATLNKTKAINWLLICIGMVRYAMEYPEKILAYKDKINLNSVLNEFTDNFGEGYSDDGKFLTDYLRTYIQKRRDEFAHSFVKRDFYCPNEFKQDRKYTFTLNGRSIT